MTALGNDIPERASTTFTSRALGREHQFHRADAVTDYYIGPLSNMPRYTEPIMYLHCNQLRKIFIYGVFWSANPASNQSSKWLTSRSHLIHNVGSTKRAPSLRPRTSSSHLAAARLIKTQRPPLQAPVGISILTPHSARCLHGITSVSAARTQHITQSPPSGELISSVTPNIMVS